jgi:hypothetical protein
VNHFLLFWWWSFVHVLKLPNPMRKMAILKIIIIAKFWNRLRVSKLVGESNFRWSTNTPHEWCLWTAVTIAMVVKIMCLNRRWKSEQVSCKICNRASPSFTHLRPLNLIFHFYVQSIQKVQHCDRHWKLVTVEPCIGWDRRVTGRKLR